MPTFAENDLFDLIALLYETANGGNEDAWLGVYHRIERLFRADSGGIFIYDKAADEFSRFIGTTPDWVYREYVETYQHMCPFREYSFRLNSGEYMLRSEILSDAKFRSLPIYEQYYSRCDILHFIYLVFLRSDGRMGGLSLARSDGKPDFSNNEVRAMQFLLHHLQRAFNFYLSNIESQIHTSLIQETFDRLPQGVMLVDESLKLIYANRAANSMLKVRSYLALDRDSRLIAIELGNDRKLRKALRNVLSSDIKTEIAIALPRGNGLRDLELTIATFKDSNIRTTTETNFAVIYLSDPDEIAPVSVGHISELYGLTRSESKIAALISNGWAVADICSELGITKNTCRTHLKRIFAKTNTNKQSELIALILSGSNHARRN